jgi:hypothetical protein
MQNVVQPDGPARGRCSKCRRLTWDPADVGHACMAIVGHDRRTCGGRIDTIAHEQSGPEVWSHGW